MKEINITCDRCKAKFTTKDPNGNTLIFYMVVKKKLDIPLDDFDICDDCIKELKTFFKKI